MPNNYFECKHFTVEQQRSNMKVCTDSCLFGAWVANKIEHKNITPKNILDIGTGSGLLSLMLAQKSDAVIHAIDIDTDSFHQADENFKSSKWNKNVFAFHADIKNWNNYTYDLIISNPPFYENSLMPAHNEKIISKHSKSLTLEDLMMNVKRLLNKNGNFAVLLPWHRVAWFEKAALSYSLYIKEKAAVKQTNQHNYFRAMLLLNETPVNTFINDLAIKNDDNKYTPEFVELLKDYYLYL